MRWWFLLHWSSKLLFAGLAELIWKVSLPLWNTKDCFL